MCAIGSRPLICTFL
uniref:Uncharacterized protein n=1 Tax=Lepeophtheirus salmonis TaxID=72036 RepID=A0A0K2V700_LEPSM